ncbi:hypothetical protein SUNI508_00379 [Seiridium unicorne]|uniref:Uncharacterized protein n=1 Tax=Seiridium unicorne TaxID=138068 RepID=A0ABR2V7L6_9PEZI
MKFSTITTILATTGSVSAAVMKVRDDKTQDQKDYDTQTKSLESDGLCRFYKGTAPEYSKYTDMCDPKCGDARKIALQDNKTFSVTCSASSPTGTTWSSDPYDKSLQFTLGQCLCNLPIVNFVGETFVEALPALGQVTCSVWKLATEDAAKILIGLPTGGASTASQTLIKVAKMLAKQGKGATEYEDYVKKHLAAGDSCDFDIKKMFEDAVKAPEEAIANVGGT